MLHRFFGGVHPSGHKGYTEGCPITPLPQPPDRVVLPMSQHVGAPCAPTVAVGDSVTVGQVIGEPTNLGAPIHASVSGKVVAVEPRPHVNGGSVMAVVIENDGLDTPADPIPRPNKPARLTPTELVEVIRAAGITGMGGAGFPAHVKLSSALGKVDTLILNGVECEPYITADHRLMLEYPEKIIQGGRILMNALGLEKCTIGVEANKLDAVEVLRSKAPADVEVRPLRVRYPQGSEKPLIQAITGRQIPPGGLPAHVKCAVFNVATAAAICDAVYEGKPMTHRVVTVTGKGVVQPGNFLVPLGTPLETLVEAAGGMKGLPGRVLSGGPMMGVAQYDLTAPVVKGSNALVVMSGREYAPTPKGELTCLHCGRCVAACPMHLVPLSFHQRFSAGNFDQLEGLRIFDCLECGSCAYICPAHIPLVQSIRAGKFEARQLQAAAKAAQEAAKAEEAAEAKKATETAAPEAEKTAEAAAKSPETSPETTTEPETASPVEDADREKEASPT